MYTVPIKCRLAVRLKSKIVQWKGINLSIAAIVHRLFCRIPVQNITSDAGRLITTMKVGFSISPKYVNYNINCFLLRLTCAQLQRNRNLYSNKIIRAC